MHRGMVSNSLLAAGLVSCAGWRSHLHIKNYPHFFYHWLFAGSNETVTTCKLNVSLCI